MEINKKNIAIHCVDETMLPLCPAGVDIINVWWQSIDYSGKYNTNPFDFDLFSLAMVE